MTKIKFQFCLVVVILFFQSINCRSLEENKTDVGAKSNREARYFPFWNVGKSSGMTCTIGMLTGTCQTNKYCKIQGGVNLGNCEGNNGVCCQFSAKCPAANGQPCIIRESGSLITNEGGVYQRRYVFPKIKGACQVKLEISSFVLAAPSATGNCETDTLTISGSPTVKHFTICGSLAEKQDLYLDFGTAENINMDINIRKAGAVYNIRPTFIRCDSASRVPSHCLQYFTGQTGQVKSFNQGLQQLNSMDYTVCVKPMEESSSIKWKQCGVDQFVITGNLGNPLGPVEGASCTTDWVEIFGGKRHCGTAFTETISFAKPFLLQVHFDDNDLPLGGMIITPGPMCTSPPQPGVICGYIDGPDGQQICQCQFGPGGGNSANFDSLNTGFCLDYMQI